MWKLFGAADIVISRAGASTMTELSSMAKTVIMVPNEELPGHHQVKNAKAYEKAEAAVVVSDSKMMKKPELLLDTIVHLLKSNNPWFTLRIICVIMICFLGCQEIFHDINLV